ncbi:MAG: hypothetical protein K6T81_19610 [Alicyclobacillus macrosporangiidus]|uniref:hypothetical protein n=1 Tax=Alicyclobacillus macrosporangiidus TaxID=392015 RepID=UPI0026EB041E|nr:hypothetical protein [Alicyclobacillus macrosporangiidus]MCL6600918.1 hypothetical protein [Alicyclobacillus macrosporangiidus]
MRVMARVSIVPTEWREYFVSKYSRQAEQVIGDNELEFYVDAPGYGELKEEIAVKNVHSNEWRYAVYSNSEIEDSKLLSIFIPAAPLDLRGDDFKYYERLCPACRVYINQKSDLVLKKEMGKRDIGMTYAHEYLISPRLKSIFEREHITGVQYRPVSHRNYEEPVAYQLVVTNTLPPLHPSSDLESSGTDCEVCGFRSVLKPWVKPLAYAAEVQSQLQDFNRSTEFFGIGIYPRPSIMASQRVRQLLIANKVEPVQYEPVLFVAS